MQFSLLPFSLLLSLVSAQTSSASSGTTSACAAQPVLEACLASTQAIAAGCSSTDYQCLCDDYKEVVKCFQQCPNDARYSALYSTQETYCSNASIYDTTTTAISRPVSSDPPTTTGAAATSGDSGSQSTDAGAIMTPTKTAASSTSSATGNAAGSDRIIGASGLLIGLAGFFGALL